MPEKCSARVVNGIGKKKLPSLCALPFVFLASDLHSSKIKRGGGGGGVESVVFKNGSVMVTKGFLRKTLALNGQYVSILISHKILSLVSQHSCH